MTEVVESTEQQDSIEWIVFEGRLNEVAVLQALGLEDSLSLAVHISNLNDSVEGIEAELKRTAVSVGDVMSGRARRRTDESHLNTKKNSDSKMSTVLQALNTGDFKISAPQTVTQQIPAGNGMFARYQFNFCFVKIPGLAEPLQLPAACFETA